MYNGYHPRHGLPRAEKQVISWLMAEGITEGLTGLGMVTEGLTGGDGDMYLPALLYGGGKAVSGGANFVGGVNRLYRGYHQNKENDRYWSDYRRNTGFAPRYPYRSGAKTDWIGWATGAADFAGNVSQGLGTKAQSIASIYG